MKMLKNIKTKKRKRIKMLKKVNKKIDEFVRKGDELRYEMCFLSVENKTEEENGALLYDITKTIFSAQWKLTNFKDLLEE